MPLDDRLKESMRRSSLLIYPDVRRDLSIVRRKARRDVIRQRITNTIIVAALVAAALYLVRDRGRHRAPRPGPQIR